MRWFVREGVDLGERYRSRREAEYAEHLAGIDSVLPDELRELARLDLRNGVIERLTVDEPERKVTLKLLIGDKESGFARLHIKYAGATFRASGAQLDWLVGYEDANVLAHEIDVNHTGFAHRLLFWPAGEFRVDFEAVEFTLAPAKSGERKRPKLRQLVALAS